MVGQNYLEKRWFPINFLKSTLDVRALTARANDATNRALKLM